MIIVSTDPENAKSFSGLSVAFRGGSHITITCSDSVVGVNEEAIVALSGGYVHAELDLGDGEPLNVHAKLVRRVEGNDYELLTCPVPKSQGGWTSCEED